MPGRRVLVVPDWYPSPERPVHGLFCREHSRAAAAAGNDVVVLARDPAAGRPCIEDGIEAGVRVVRVRVPCRLGPLRTSVDLAAVAAGAAHLGRRGWRPDVVHAHVFSSGAVALPIARAARAPLVVSEHLTSITRGHLGRRDLAALRFAYRGAALVAPCSQDLARHIAQLEPRAHLEVVPNVVDGGRFHPPQPAAPAAERLLFVAFLNEKKGVPDLLEAVALLRATRPALTLDVIGDGPDRAALEAQAARLGIADRVRFQGVRMPDEIADAMRQADLFVLPSHVENAPVVLIEAGASGLPIVATAVGGVPELVDATWGELVPARDPRALAGAIDGTLARGAPDRDAIARRVVTRHGLHAVGARWDAIYDDVRVRSRATARRTSKA